MTPQNTPSPTSYLRLSKITKYFPGDPRPALRDVSLELRRGAVLALLGESGSGKTTLLRLVAGFEPLSAGTIELAGALIGSRHRAVPPEQRGVGMVFQDTALLPHLTIMQNVAFGLRRLSEDARQQIAEQTLKRLHIADLRDRFPHEVSGGQAQRAAIGRALAPKPSLLLLDEPFNNLDPVLKWEMLHELRAVLLETGTTALFVTHDRDEAFTIADTMALLRRGHVEQAGDAETMYAAPASAFVARYLGAVNLIPVQRRGSALTSALGVLDGMKPFQYRGVDTVSVRPWQLSIARIDPGPDADHNGAAGVRGIIRAFRFMGEYHEVRVQAATNSDVQELTVHATGTLRFRVGDRVVVALRGADASP